MNKVALGYITMNAGDDIPGSIVKWALKTYSKYYDYTVVVDGNLTEEAKTFYSSLEGDIRIINSPWNATHLPQYHARNSAVDEGNWILALDDDEFPNNNLVGLNNFVRDGKLETHNIVYIPSLTYLCTDSSNNFWRVQTSPSREDFLRRSKRILYKKNQRSNYFISSPCGMHVTPTQVSQDGRLDEKPVGDPTIFFYHMKTLESFIWNECVYNVSNPKHESGPQARQMTREQEDEFIRLVEKYELKNIPKFLQMTKDRAWPEEFKNFVYQFKDILGQAMCKFFYAYEYISKKDFSNIKSLIYCISTGFIPVYEEVMDSIEAPISIPRTPSIWQ